MENNFTDKIKHWQYVNLGLIIFDILAIVGSYFFALLLRFDFIYSLINDVYIDSLKILLPVYTVFTILTFSKLNMYKKMWRFAGVEDVFSFIYAMLITTIFNVLFSVIFVKRMPIAYYVIGAMLQFILTSMIRFIYRILLNIENRNKQKNKESKNVLIVGAGEAGKLVYNDIIKYEVNSYDVKGFIDDNANKIGRFIGNIPILGDRYSIPSAVEENNIDIIIVAIPSSILADRQEILDICKETRVKLKIVPSLPEFLSDSSVGMKKLKDVQIEDLLEREPIKVNTDDALKNIEGKVVLVTGGGGTIGSELCRQIAGHKPSKLIIFDIYENNAYEIEQELKRKHPDLEIIALIGSVREERRLDDIFNQYRPNIVYHAAAHKHVPLMETSPNEAIKNNLYGTYNSAFAALRYKVEKFILISTDKAVNPTNIMGATKRACEMIIQSMARINESKDLSILPDLSLINPREIRPFDTDFNTNFVAVRFGNVLGSNGSVIPLFKKQIAEGGPVTITHKDIIRYFMTIPEAVGLVIEAGFYAKGGEIFVLDMGEPVKIDTLARNLIKLSGLRPEKDIEIKYVGLRPGEKLYEEKLMSEEGLEKTENELIHVAKPINFDSATFFKQIEDYQEDVVNNNTEHVVEKMTEIVPTYHSAESDIEKNKEKFEKMYENSK